MGREHETLNTLWPARVGGISEGLEQCRKILQFLVTGRGHMLRSLPSLGLERGLTRATCFSERAPFPEAGWLSRFLVSTENDGGLPGSPSHLLFRMFPRLDTLAFEGVYRDSCCPPPGRGDIRPTLGTEKSLYVSSGTAAPPRSSHRGSLFPLPGQSPGRPNALSSSARCTGSQASWPRPHSLFTKPGRYSSLSSPEPDWLIFRASSTSDWSSLGRATL